MEEDQNASNPSGLTIREQAVADALVAAWNSFQLIVATYSVDDCDDFRRAIHEAQRILMSRIVARNYPKYWR